MPRKRKGQPINGWIVIDKPLNISSAAVVNRVRKALDAAKAGHGGTLDPLASGILPVALGEATKTVSYVMDGSKTYDFTICWGEARSTDDREGEVIATSAVRPTRDAILAALPRFMGEIEQVPPAFSAVKVDGKRAYDLARAEQDVVLAARKVRIDSLDLAEMPDSDHARLIMRCGKGTYVRSLARDLAAALGTVGHVSALRRTACGPFEETDAIPLDKLEEFGHSAASCTAILPVETALDDIPALALTAEEASRLRSGQPVAFAPVAARGGLPDIQPGQTLRAMTEGRLVALARIEAETIRSVRGMNL